MRRIFVAAGLSLVLSGCHDSEQFLPTAPEFQNALVVDPLTAALPADGFSTLKITATVDAAAAAANRIIEFTATDGTFVEGKADNPKTAERTVDVSGIAVVHLRSSQHPGEVQVVVRIKAKPEVAKTITVAFTPAGSDSTLVLSADRTSAPADDFTATVITARLAEAVPTSGRSVTFTTTRGKFLQTNAVTATVTADATGRARVDLVGDVPGAARITATAFNVIADIGFTFLPSLPEIILVQPNKRQIEAGLDADASTTVTIRMLRSTGKVTIGTVPLIRVIAAATGAELPFLIGQVTDTNASGVAQAVITSGPTEFRGTARIEVRVAGSPVVGSETIEVIATVP